MNNFLDNIYGIIFSPRETFEKLFQNPSLIQGFVIVAVVSILGTLLNFECYRGGQCVFLLGFKTITSAIGGIISWLFFASFIELVASVFKQSGKIKEFLCLSAFALVPWIFVAPVELLKTGGVPGGVFGILIGLGIWIWVTVLIFMALIRTYNLSFGRTVILLVMPFFAGFLAFNWITGFFVTMFNILKI